MDKAEPECINFYTTTRFYVNKLINSRILLELEPYVDLSKRYSYLELISIVLAVFPSLI